MKYSFLKQFSSTAFQFQHRIRLKDDQCLAAILRCLFLVSEFSGLTSMYQVIPNIRYLVDLCPFWMLDHTVHIFEIIILQFTG